ncbi:MAG: SDR family oxidoreductase [Myxococcales bacterium]|nr:SDR family oxidoreductase [Myxococcales bacterium]
MAISINGYRAFITGASGGIGAAIADELARQGVQLVLVARRRDALEAVAQDLRARHGAVVSTLTADLGVVEERRRTWDEAIASGPIDMLVNNAGFGHHRPFAAVDAGRDQQMLALNIEAVVDLAHWFVDHKIASDPAHARRAYILNVASVAAYQPVPNMATYAASKAFVHQWSRALHLELATKNIAVCSLNPGGTHTDFHRMAGAGSYGRLARMSMMGAPEVATIGVRALLRGRPVVVPGLANKLSCWLVSLAPRGLAAQSARWVMGTPKTEQLPPTTNRG